MMFAKKEDRGGKNGEKDRYGIGLIARRKLKRSMLLLAFTAAFAVLLAFASKRENGNGELSAGAFGARITLLAIRYDCADIDIDKTIESDLETMLKLGYSPVLPNETDGMNSNGVLIVLENIEYSQIGINTLFENGMKAVTVIDADLDGRTARSVAELISSGCAEAVALLSEHGNETRTAVLAELCDIRLVLMSRFGIEPMGFLLEREFASSELFEHPGFGEDIMFFAEGNGINEARDCSTDTRQFSIIRRSSFDDIEKWLFK